MALLLVPPRFEERREVGGGGCGGPGSWTLWKTRVPEFVREGPGTGLRIGTPAGTDTRSPTLPPEEGQRGGSPVRSFPDPSSPGGLELFVRVGPTAEGPCSLFFLFEKLPGPTSTRVSSISRQPT